MNSSGMVRAALALLLGLMLAACGPGVGGTGTGNSVETPGLVGLAYFEAQPAHACSAPFAAVIGCREVAGAEPRQPLPATLAGECGAATFEGNDVVLDVICQGWTFTGRWGATADGKRRYYGLLSRDLLLPPTEPAALEVQVQGTALVLWLRGADGQPLVGPLRLEPPR